MLPYQEQVKEVLKAYEVDEQEGLYKSQIEKRFLQYGENTIVGKKRKTLLLRFIDQFRDIMILILVVSAVISFVIACNGHNKKEFIEPLLIILIVILNAVIGVIQENRAQNALEALKNMSAPHARVVRGGEEMIIDAKELVPGDVMLLEAGDLIPADARLIEAASLKTDESVLSGESLPVEKEADLALDAETVLGERRNMIYSGCSICYGRCRAVVVGTGMNSEIGKIAGLINEEEETITPLQKKLAELGKYIGIMAIVICIIIFLIGLLDGLSVLELFMTSVSLAVAAIPEGLPAIVTVVLSLGVERMVRRNAIIKRLPAVEALGSASVICSDKTGTLTQNKMTIKMAYDGENDESEVIKNENGIGIRRLLAYAALCCDGSIVMTESEEKQIGDPTETSILLAAYENGITKEQLNEKYTRVAEIPFDSERKRMSVIVKDDEGYIVIAKGGFDEIKQCCILKGLAETERKTTEFSMEALRVLAVGYKRMEEVPDEITVETIETELHMLGIVGMIDPPREEAGQAVAMCKRAGIRPVMITGDHVLTASAIASQIGILNKTEQAITGSQLKDMSQEELQDQVQKISVYARVSPEDKIRIVKAWKTKGAVVAMTGDGVNDAPALKAADIGCAMGITGTDVAKEAADMILTDDNFSTIVDAVKEGRGIYNNIRKTISYLLGANIGEVITVFFAMLIFKRSPLLSMQLLWINLVTDSFPAIALGMEPLSSDVMKEKPRGKDENIFSGGMGRRIILQGIMFGVLAIFSFYYGCGFRVTSATVESGRTMAFAVLGFSQIVNAFNMRSQYSLFRIGFFGNRALNIAGLISILLMCVVLLIPPVTYAFGMVSLQGFQYVAVILLSIIPFVVVEGSKRII